MAYDTVPDALDEYLQMGTTTARGNLEAIASHDIWIWNAFFGVYGMNNDVNVLRQSPICNDLKAGKAPDALFVANDVAYKRGYYLTDRIYPEWSVLIKSISNPGNDHKRIMYKTMHEAAQKDVERAFGVLKMEWKIIKQPARGTTLSLSQPVRDDSSVEAVMTPSKRKSTKRPQQFVKNDKDVADPWSLEEDVAFSSRRCGSERREMNGEEDAKMSLIKNFDDIKARIEADRILAEKLQSRKRAVHN
ncbi:ALP1-like protein [Tanacetum coccineum]